MIRPLTDKTVVSLSPHDSAGHGGERPLTTAALFEEHAQTVACWASKLGGPGIDAEDVVQEVFVVVHRRVAQFRGESSVASWLYGITANVVRQQRRRARRRRWFGLGDPVPDYQVAAGPSPVEDLERRRRAAAVYRVLDKMREANRTVLILAEMEGLSGEEIASLTGMKVGTVWVRLHRARAEFSSLARKLIPGEVETALEQRATDDPRERP